MGVQRISLLVLTWTYFTLIQINGNSSYEVGAHRRICQNGGTQFNTHSCLCPGGLIGKYCNHSLYVSFDTYGPNMALMEGTEERFFNALVQGPVYTAVSLNRNRNQWIDLGVHPEVCLANRYMCGVAGGAMSLWVKLNDCPRIAGIITTTTDPTAFREAFQFITGFYVYCSEPEGFLEYVLILPTGQISTSRALISNQQPHWFHILFNFVGPNTGHGFTVYHDGVMVENVTRIHSIRATSIDRRIVIGRLATDRDEFYSSLEMDEVLFFNKALTDAEIRMLIPKF